MKILRFVLCILTFDFPILTFDILCFYPLKPNP